MGRNKIAAGITDDRHSTIRLTTAVSTSYQPSKFRTVCTQPFNSYVTPRGTAEMGPRMQHAEQDPVGFLQKLAIDVYIYKAV